MKEKRIRNAAGKMAEVKASALKSSIVPPENDKSIYCKFAYRISRKFGRFFFSVDK